jgi:uncharacterized membrane protein
VAGVRLDAHAEGDGAAPVNSPGWTGAQLVALYVVTLLVLGALDGAWLGWLAKDLYRREMGELMAASPRLVPAALFYFAYPVAVVYFGLLPLAPGSGATIGEALLRCGALGLVAYGTYDLTNLSVIRGFSMKLALIDMVWGTAVSAVSGAAAFAAVRWWALRG